MVQRSEQRRSARTSARHAIPPARDQQQSRLLLFCSLTVILACIAFGLLSTGDQGGFTKFAAVSLAFAVIAGGLRSATIGGAICGALACFCMTWWTRDSDLLLRHSALPPLVMLVVLTVAATRFGSRQKQALGLEERRGGRRASQVLANLSIAALVATPLGAYAGVLLGIAPPVDVAILAAACVAVLAEATADTVSSEMGQAFGRRTYMLTTLRRVHRGTDGGVSVVGTGAGLASALGIVLVGGWSMRLSGGAQVAAFSAAVIGFLVDSLLGATVERRGWIGNDVVNLSSTVCAALALLLMARLASGF